MCRVHNSTHAHKHTHTPHIADHQRYYFQQQLFPLFLDYSGEDGVGERRRRRGRESEGKEMHSSYPYILFIDKME